MYDEKCYDLAKFFLSTEITNDERLEKHAKILAQELQESIENYIEDLSVED